jgi:hypothetical protein
MAGAQPVGSTERTRALSYLSEVESAKASTNPQVTTSGTITGVTVSNSYEAISGKGAALGTFTAGLPTITGGQWYGILTTVLLT